MTKRPNIKKGPTTHTFRPTVHPYGTSIDFTPVRSYRVSERDRSPAKVQDAVMERARQKRQRRRGKRENEVETGGWR